MSEILLPNPAPEPNQEELDIQRRLTTAFIATQPVQITLVPRERVKKPAGGFAWEERPPRNTQTMRFVEPGSIPLPVVTVDGIQREIEFQLLGEWDAEIGQDDVFTTPDAEWRVIRLAPFNGWEQRALVLRVG